MLTDHLAYSPPAVWRFVRGELTCPATPDSNTETVTRCLMRWSCSRLEETQFANLILLAPRDPSANPVVAQMLAPP